MLGILCVAAAASIISFSFRFFPQFILSVLQAVTYCSSSRQHFICPFLSLRFPMILLGSFVLFARSLALYCFSQYYLHIEFNVHYYLSHTNKHMWIIDTINLYSDSINLFRIDFSQQNGERIDALRSSSSKYLEMIARILTSHLIHTWIWALHLVNEIYKPNMQIYKSQLRTSKKWWHSFIWSNFNLLLRDVVILGHRFVFSFAITFFEFGRIRTCYIVP